MAPYPLKNSMYFNIKMNDIVFQSALIKNCITFLYKESETDGKISALN